MKEKERKKRVKMIDVARRAGVSQTTVSFVLNRIEGVRIPDATREHVIAVAEELGYSPGPLLDELKSERSSLVGVLINEISSAYPIDIIDGLNVAAQAAGVQLVIFVTDGVMARENAALLSLRKLGGRDVIYANTFTTAVQATELLREFRHVYVNCFPHDGNGTAVIPGERAAGFAAAQYLLHTGARRLASITGDAWHTSAQRRLSGFRRGLTAAGSALDPEMVVHADWGHAMGYEAMLGLLRRPDPPDAVFCQNDMLARGALAALADRGLQVPGDVSVLGMDDREFARHLGLSTMSLPHAGMAERGLKILLSDRPLDQGQVISVRCPLVPRRTTPDQVEPAIAWAGRRGRARPVASKA